nr:eukaryotic translation initiation factor 2D [Tanacetum cinerariifolium]
MNKCRFSFYRDTECVNTATEGIPAFILMGGEVSYYVTGGKDLMFPGISIGAEGLPEFSTGETWAVIVPSWICMHDQL